MLWASLNPLMFTILSSFGIPHLQTRWRCGSKGRPSQKENMNMNIFPSVLSQSWEIGNATRERFPCQTSRTKMYTSVLADSHRTKCAFNKISMPVSQLTTGKNTHRNVFYSIWKQFKLYSMLAEHFSISNFASCVVQV